MFVRRRVLGLSGVPTIWEFRQMAVKSPGNTE
jgi:hypothetical protein